MKLFSTLKHYSNCKCSSINYLRYFNKFAFDLHIVNGNVLEPKALNTSLQTLQSWDLSVTIPLITLKRLHGQTKSEQKQVP